MSALDQIALGAMQLEDCYCVAVTQREFNGEEDIVDVEVTHKLHVPTTCELGKLVHELLKEHGCMVHCSVVEEFDCTMEERPDGVFCHKLLPRPVDEPVSWRYFFSVDRDLKQIAAAAKNILLQPGRELSRMNRRRACSLVFENENRFHNGEEGTVDNFEEVEKLTNEELFDKIVKTNLEEHYHFPVTFCPEGTRFANDKEVFNFAFYFFIDCT